MNKLLIITHGIKKKTLWNLLLFINYYEYFSEAI